MSLIELPEYPYSVILSKLDYKDRVTMLKTFEKIKLRAPKYILPKSNVFSITNGSNKLQNTFCNFYLVHLNFRGSQGKVIFLPSSG